MPVRKRNRTALTGKHATPEKPPRTGISTPALRAMPRVRGSTEWEERIAILRQTCETLPQQQAAMFLLAEEGYTSVFEQLVMAIISVRTTEEVTLPASRRLLSTARAPGAIARMGVEEIAELIAPATYPHAKARDIHAIAVAARDRFGGALPCDVEVLKQFRGVGPKVANLAVAVSNACDGPAGIPVDIHVHRVTNRWGVISAATPNESGAQLEAILPRAYWAEINRLLVPFGKFICTAVRPKCSICPMNRLCEKVGVTDHR
jgi:endonuclease-3